MGGGGSAQCRLPVDRLHPGGGGASMLQKGMHPGTPANRMTHACENITFVAFLRNAAGNNSYTKFVF